MRLSAVPLAWAVREPVRRGDLATVATHVEELARDPIVRRVAVAPPDGKVRIASDHGREGKDASAVFPGLPLGGETPRVASAGRETVVVVPVMGLTRRVGTVIVAVDRRAGR